MWSSKLLIYLNFLGYSGHTLSASWFGLGKLDEWILILIKHDGLEFQEFLSNIEERNKLISLSGGTKKIA